MSTQVQALTIAMFGAYAGGYTADIQARVDSWGLAAAADSLVGFQQPLLGLDLSDDAVWIDVLLGNLGIDSTNAAYTEAQAWAASNLAGGASRGEVVAAAVTYLQGDVAPAFQAIADAFEAQVAAGVTYSAGEGADEVAIGALRVAAGNPDTATGFNLTAALAELNSANEALSDFLQDTVAANTAVAKVLGTNTDPTDTEVENALTGEDGAYTAAETELDVLVSGDLAGSSATKDAILIAAQKDLLTADVTSTTKAVEAVTGLKTLVDALAGKVTSFEGALDDAYGTKFDLQSEIAAYNFHDGDADNTYAIFGTTSATLKITSDADGSGTDSSSADFLTWDATKGTFVLQGTPTDAQKAAAADLIAAANAYRADLADVEAAKTALESAITKVVEKEGSTVAGTYYEVTDTTATAGASIAVDLNGGTLSSNDAPKAQSYLDAIDALAAFNKANDAYAPLAALVAELSSLKGDAADALEVLTLQDYAIDQAPTAGTKDIITSDFTDAVTDATIAVGSFGADDVILVDGFVRNAGKVATDGDNAVVEYFLTEDAGGNTTISFETKAYGSDIGDSGTVDITLLGVSIAELEIGATYIKLA